MSRQLCDAKKKSTDQGSNNNTNGQFLSTLYDELKHKRL